MLGLRRITRCWVVLAILCLFCHALMYDFVEPNYIFSAQLHCVATFLVSVSCALLSLYDYFKYKNRFAIYGFVVGVINLLFVPTLYFSAFIVGGRT